MDIHEYVQGLLQTAEDRRQRGLPVYADRRLHAVSALDPGGKELWVLVTEVRHGGERAALYRSAAPGDLRYSAEDVHDHAQCQDPDFLARAEALAREHTLSPAVQRRYPRQEAAKP